VIYTLASTRTPRLSQPLYQNVEQRSRGVFIECEHTRTGDVGVGGVTDGLPVRYLRSLWLGEQLRECHELVAAFAEAGDDGWECFGRSRRVGLSDMEDHDRAIVSAPQHLVDN
jgi:hypothetical protein